MVGMVVMFLLQGLVWTFWLHTAMRFLGGLFSGSRLVCQGYKCCEHSSAAAAAQDDGICGTLCDVGVAVLGWSWAVASGNGYSQVMFK